MKSIRACTVLLSLVGGCLFLQLGLDYLDPEIAIGLHPAIASVGVLALCLAIAYSVMNFGSRK